MYFTIAAAVFCGVVVLWYVLTYNSLTKARNAVDQAWSHIEVELKRRLDLIQNLVEIAKGYAKYERETFTQVAALRTQARPFSDATAANSAEPDLRRTISSIMVLAENYPQLRRPEFSQSAKRVDRDRKPNRRATAFLQSNGQHVSEPDPIRAVERCCRYSGFFGTGVFRRARCGSSRTTSGKTLMKKLILPFAIVGMMLLLAAAYTWDSLRTAANARHRVELADDEMHKHEQRLLKLLGDSDKTTPEVQTAVKAYQSATDPQERHERYGQIVSGFQKTMASQVDPTNPLDRKFIDEISGAINRRDVAQKQYEAESAAYKSILNGFRGSIAKIFSSRARADAKSSDKP